MGQGCGVHEDTKNGGKKTGTTLPPKPALHVQPVAKLVPKLLVGHGTAVHPPV